MFNAQRSPSVAGILNPYGMLKLDNISDAYLGPLQHMQHVIWISLSQLDNGWKLLWWTGITNQQAEMINSTYKSNDDVY